MATPWGLLSSIVERGCKSITFSTIDSNLPSIRQPTNRRRVVNPEPDNGRWFGAALPADFHRNYAAVSPVDAPTFSQRASATLRVYSCVEHEKCRRASDRASCLVVVWVFCFEAERQVQGVYPTDWLIVLWSVGQLFELFSLRRTNQMADFSSIPTSAELWGLLVFRLAVPLLMALVMVVILRRREETHWKAWTAATFFAGIGNGGLGSIAVALLYHTVE